MRSHAVDNYLLDFGLGEHGPENIWKAWNQGDDLLFVDDDVCNYFGNDSRQY